MVFVRYADEWLVGVGGTKEEGKALRAEMVKFLNTKRTFKVEEEHIKIIHHSKKIRFLRYEISVRRSQKGKGDVKPFSLSVILTIPHQEKIEQLLFAKKAVIQIKEGRLKPVHRTALLNRSDEEIVKQYRAEMKELLQYRHYAADYHTLRYFCYLRTCLKCLQSRKSLIKWSQKGLGHVQLSQRHYQRRV